jgi:hypothetical protein
VAVVFSTTTASFSPTDRSDSGRGTLDMPHDEPADVRAHREPSIADRR